MNKIYKVVFNKATQTFVAVSELAKGQGKSSTGSNSKKVTTAKSSAGFTLSALTAMVLMAICSQSAFANNNFIVGNNTDGDGVICWSATNPNGTQTATDAAHCHNGNYSTLTFANSTVTRDPDADGYIITIDGSGPLPKNYFHVNNTGAAVASNGTNYDTVDGTGGAAGNESVAAGVNTQSFGSRSVAVGFEATTADEAANSVAIGNNASATDDRGVAIGHNATAADRGVAIGGQSEATNKLSSAIGFNTHATKKMAVAVGVRSTVNNQKSAAFGIDNKIDGTFNPTSLAGILGTSGVTSVSDLGLTTEQQTQVANILKSKNAKNIVTGVNNTVTDSKNTLTTGGGNTTTGSIMTATYGSLNKVTGSVAAGVYGIQNTIKKSAGVSITGGQNTITKSNNSFIVGGSNTIEGSSGDIGVFGAKNKVDKTKVLSIIGDNNTVSGSGADIGTKVGALGIHGSDNTVTDVSNVRVIGNSNTATVNNVFVLGSEITADVTNSVYLGDTSRATAGSGTGDGTIKAKKSDGSDGATTTAGATGTVTNAKINDVTYGDFAGAESFGVITVGASGSERRIQNVAAGEITKTSTDAINGSQLYAVANTASEALNKQNYFHVNGTGSEITAILDSNDPNYDPTDPAVTNLDSVNGTGGAVGVNALAAGVNTQALGYGAIAIGQNVKATGTNSVVIGGSGSNEASAFGAVAIGRSVKATHGFATALGLSTTASGVGSTAMGHTTTASGTIGATAMGHLTIASGDWGSTAIGNKTMASGAWGATAIGTWTKAKGTNSFAAGNYAVAEGESSYAIGNGAQAIGNGSFALGGEVTVYYPISGNSAPVVTEPGGIAYTSGSMAMGTGTVAGTRNGTEEAFAMGYRAKATADKTMALGFDAQATVDEAVAIGSDAVASRSASTTDNTQAGFAGYNPITDAYDGIDAGIKATHSTLAAVAVGDAKNSKFRQITGVAAGTEDSDAVNVAQLKALANTGWNLQETGTAVDEVKNGDTVNFVASVNGTEVASGATGPFTVSNESDEKLSKIAYNFNYDKNVFEVNDNGELTLVSSTTTVTDTDDQSTGGGGTITSTGGAGSDLTINAGKNLVADATDDPDAITISTAENVEFTEVKVGDTINITKDGIDMGDTSITNVADGVNDGDVVNVSQLKASKEVVKSDDKSVTVETTQNADGANVFDLSVNTDDTTITKDPNTGAITAVTSDITSNTDGSVDGGSNPDGLATAGDVADAINSSGFTVKANGDAGELITSGDEVNFKNGRNIELTRNGSDITVSTAKNARFESVNIGEAVTITDNGINAGGTKITNLAPGTAPTDAANVGQLQNASRNLYRAINDVSREAKAGIASSAAFAMLGHARDAGDSAVSAGIAVHEGEAAVAVGVSAWSDNGKWLLKGALSQDTQSQTTVGASATYNW